MQRTDICSVKYDRKKQENENERCLHYTGSTLSLTHGCLPWFVLRAFLSCQTVENHFRLPQTSEIPPLDISPVLLVSGLSGKEQVAHATQQIFKVG